MVQIPFKELYLTFRVKVENARHFEEKWVEGLHWRHWRH